MSLEFSSCEAARSCIKTKERQMKIISVIAVVVALLGTANFASAQSNPSLEDNTGSASNARANTHQGEYQFGD
jgi:hypothetical protein